MWVSPWLPTLCAISFPTPVIRENNGFNSGQDRGLVPHVCISVKERATGRKSRRERNVSDSVTSWNTVTDLWLKKLQKKSSSYSKKFEKNPTPPKKTRGVLSWMLTVRRSRPSCIFSPHNYNWPTSQLLVFILFALCDRQNILDYIRMILLKTKMQLSPRWKKKLNIATLRHIISIYLRRRLFTQVEGLNFRTRVSIWRI